MSLLYYLLSFLSGISKRYLYNVGENTIKGVRWWMLAGGLFGAFYIFTTIFASPKIGFANMFSLVICGQIILAILFDHFGLLGNDVHLITLIELWV